MRTLAGVRPNLLDNGDFRAGHIVNQWGRTSVSADGQFLFDRWRTYRYVSGTASVTENGVNLAGNFDFGETIESSRIPNTPNFRVTISAMFSDGSFVSKTGTLGNTGAAEMFQIAVTQYTNLQFIRNWNTGVDLFFFHLLSEDNITPIAAKLETGSTQTLAYQDETGAWQLLPQPESDYAAQLAKCQRYFFAPKDVFGAAMIANTEYSLYGSIQFPVTMRAAPTISDATARRMNTGDTISLAGIVVDSQKNENGLTFLNCYGNNVFTAGEYYQVSFKASADL